MLAPTSISAVVMMSRQRVAWTATSSGHEPSGHTGAVPETITRALTRSARLKPIVFSNGEPDEARTRSVTIDDFTFLLGASQPPVVSRSPSHEPDDCWTSLSEPMRL